MNARTVTEEPERRMRSGRKGVEESGITFDIIFIQGNLIRRWEEGDRVAMITYYD